ncbi:hypothetical protein [Pontibacter mangrovi]|uniref:Uncharacterized protein n=1 Tax=Pontibacter mangrovi TaxID=2589816 RepID=A0A501W9I6_9BACT|nr:hypothetical protein [Pontibacter mangrovi]TPE43941.1 hypothetical protein FJM65_10985 [Pontibacter mangrovi]
MELPQQYFILKAFHKQLFRIERDNGYTVGKIRKTCNDAAVLIDELVDEHPTDQLVQARASALPLLQQALHEADAYDRGYDHDKRLSSTRTFMQVLTPAINGLEVFLHTGF